MTTDCTIDHRLCTVDHPLCTVDHPLCTVDHPLCTIDHPLQHRVADDGLLCCCYIQVYYTFLVGVSSRPHDLVQMVIEKREKTTGCNIGPPEHFVLKVCGREDYLIGDYPLSQFMVGANSVTTHN